MPEPLRVLEFFCGIGGCATALGVEAGASAEVVAAIDISDLALSVYRHNFPRHRASARAIERLTDEDLRSFEADLWWLSPPCQPFTRRGLGRDLDDPRSAGLKRVIAWLAEDRLDRFRPRFVALENVLGFEKSRAHGRLREVLRRAGYEIRERLLCPSELGMPNRRPRYYLIAARGEALGGWRDPEITCSIGQMLDPQPDAELTVSTELKRRYPFALHRVSADDPDAVTACFTSAYGRSPVRSGSYLEQGSALRRFSPGEILRLLGYPKGFELPPELPLEKGWRLVGNSLSVPAVRAVLRPVLDLLQEPVSRGKSPESN